MPESEIKQCQNCKEDFTIEPDDFDFYKKIDVPPPTFCPECRAVRRMMFWNERHLFRKQEAAEGKKIFSTYPDKAENKIYEHSYWWSDKWDATDHGRDYDFSRPFFEQYKELMYEVPWQDRSVLRLKNSDYCNQASDLKDCYLCFNGMNAENCMYVVNFDNVKDSVSLVQVGNSELCYGSFSLDNSYKTLFSTECRSCQNVWFSLNCDDCSDCFGCVNLKHQKYHIFNEPYTKEEYEKKLEEMNLGSYRSLKEIKEKVREHWLKYPQKFFHGIQNVNSTGDYMFNSKNAKQVYQCGSAEDVRYCISIFNDTKDSYDYLSWGRNAELIYESAVCGENVRNLKFCFECWPSSQNLEYSIHCHSSSDCFGCIGLRKKQYCILNKQYSKEEYEELVPKIKAHMEEMPYKDSKRHTYKYGEFFPSEFSPLAYNESGAGDYFPLAKEEAEKKGHLWREIERKDFEVTLNTKDLPDNIADVGEEVLKEIIECTDCGRVYRVLASELQIYKRLGVPLPRNCPECRYKELIGQRNIPKWYSRSCQCAGDKSDPPSRTGIKNKELGIKEFATDIETNQQPTTDNLQQGTEDIDNKESKTRGTYTNTSKNHPDHAPDEHCPNEFQTSYSPDRPEIIYCENCYQNEVT